MTTYQDVQQMIRDGRVDAARAAIEADDAQLTDAQCAELRAAADEAETLLEQGCAHRRWLTTSIDPDAYDVYDYDSGDGLPGLPTEELVCESEAASPTGAVHAYYDTAESRWEYVPPADVERVQRRGEKVRTVYVMEA